MLSLSILLVNIQLVFIFFPVQAIPQCLMYIFLCDLIKLLKSRTGGLQHQISLILLDVVKLFSKAAVLVYRANKNDKVFIFLNVVTPTFYEKNFKFIEKLLKWYNKHMYILQQLLTLCYICFAFLPLQNFSGFLFSIFQHVHTY